MTLRRRLLRVLGGLAVPVPTCELVAACAARLGNPRSRVWRELRDLERAGAVVRTHRPVRGARGPHRWAYWALAVRGGC